MQVPPGAWGRIRVRIEMHDPDAARGTGRGNSGRRRPGDRVIATDHHGNDASRSDIADTLADPGVRVLGHSRQAARVPVVDDAKHIEWLHLELEVPLGALVGRGADSARAEARPRPVRDSLVPRGSDDGDVRAHLVELIGGRQQRYPAEGRRPEVRGSVVIPLHGAKTSVSRWLSSETACQSSWG